MKSRILAFMTAVFLLLAGTARPQEIFNSLRNGDIPAVKALVERTPAILDSRDRNGLTPLHYAASQGDAGLVNYFLDKGAKPDPPGIRQTPLHLAAQDNRTEAAAALLRRGAALEARDDYLRTPLILCARERGQLATARTLLEAGADVNAIDKFGDTALGLAAWRGKAELVDYLLEKGAQVPKSGPQWQGMVSQAASKGLTKLFRRLTEGEQYLKAADRTAQFLIHYAAAGGSAEIVGLLLDEGFNPAKADRFGWTPLHYAARDGRSDAARILIDRGAPLDIRTIMGQTAYNVAQERGMQATATLLAEKGADKSGIRFPVLEGDYLSQKPPADRAELFGVGIVSSIWGLHSTTVFSPDGNEVYWAPMMTFPGEIYSRGGLLTMKRVNGRWTAPVWASFSGPDFQDDVPFFSPDGKRMYFISRRPLPGETKAGSEKIWSVDRTATGWSEPRPLDETINSQQMHWQFSLDRSGNLYFPSAAPGGFGMDDIYMARITAGKYEKPVNLGKLINSAAGETTPFIALDGSYLIYSRQYDLWVSFRGADGAWSASVNLGPEVNSPEIELCPMVTADGKYLFFLSQRDGESHVYWVSATVIEKARPRPPSATAAVDYSVIFYSGRSGNDDVFILHPGEKEPRNLTNHPAKDICPAPSPDGRRIAFLSDRSGNQDVFLMNIDGSGLKQLTASPEKEQHPEFSPDGQRMVFVRDFGERSEIWMMAADGSGQERLTSGSWRDERPFLSPDGSKILFMSNRDGNYEIYTMAPDGSRQTRITRTPHHEVFPVWSPDGKRIAYSRKFLAEGRMQGMIRVMNADGSDDREITAIETRDENAMWSPDGRFIIFQSVRERNFEIYRVNADGSRPIRLTDHPAWDGWASYVPSGKLD
jgi:TolB protein